MRIAAVLGAFMLIGAAGCGTEADTALDDGPGVEVVVSQEQAARSGQGGTTSGSGGAGITQIVRRPRGGGPICISCPFFARDADGNLVLVQPAAR